MSVAEYQRVSIRVNVNLTQKQVTEGLILADDHFLSWKRHDSGVVFCQGIHNNV